MLIHTCVCTCTCMYSIVVHWMLFYADCRLGTRYRSKPEGSTGLLLSWRTRKCSLHCDTVCISDDSAYGDLSGCVV